MNNNYYVSKTVANRNGDGTVVYYTFTYPTTGNQENGNVLLTNDEFKAAIANGTTDDLYAGLYKIIQEKIVEQNSGTVTSTGAAN